MSPAHNLAAQSWLFSVFDFCVCVTVRLDHAIFL